MEVVINATITNKVRNANNVLVMGITVRNATMGITSLKYRTMKLFASIVLAIREM
jgi:phage terminase large subunit-like protein